jgi:hypothetical protein
VLYVEDLVMANSMLKSKLMMEIGKLKVCQSIQVRLGIEKGVISESEPRLSI